MYLQCTTWHFRRNFRCIYSVLHGVSGGTSGVFTVYYMVFREELQVYLQCTTWCFRRNFGCIYSVLHGVSGGTSGVFTVYYMVFQEELREAQIQAEEEERRLQELERQVMMFYSVHSVSGLFHYHSKGLKPKQFISK